MTRTTKKLIEVALPLDAINAASAREKSIRHGHPSTLHLWWARRPLAAARAVIFAQMVDDPSEHTDVLLSDPAKKRKAMSELNKRRDTWNKRKAAYDEPLRQESQAAAEPGPEPTLDECAADLERERLFAIIRELVKWENTTNETVLQQARDEIWQSWRYACAANADHPRATELFDRYKLPAFHDPFAGGGALPLEAQRLGLEAYASDLNPVAVLINKAMIEIPLMFVGRAPVNPEAFNESRLLAQSWTGAAGLAEDVRYYGNWMRREAEKRIGHLYPKIEITSEMTRERPDLKPLSGRKLTVIAWIWARTVKSPNPAYSHVDVPLASTFILSRMKGNEAYVEPVFTDTNYYFNVKSGRSQNFEQTKKGTKLARANFVCLMSGSPIPNEYVKAEGMAGRMGARMMAVVAEGDRGRVYLSPTAAMEAVARQAKPEWQPDLLISGSTQYLGVKPYGMDLFSQLYTERQLTALDTFCDLVSEVREQVRHDILHQGNGPGYLNTTEGHGRELDYPDAVATYLGFVVSSLSDRLSTLCIWDAGGATWGTKLNHVFGRQAIPMSWDYAEANPLSNQSGSFWNSLDYTSKGISVSGPKPGLAIQADAAKQDWSEDKLVSTDPPYYDNIPYADLSDYFYVWLRRSLKSVFPELFATLAVPKSDELVAFAYRHDNRKDLAEQFFLSGMTRAMQRLAELSHPAFPVSIYYAFKQSEDDGHEGVVSTGWETFLDAVIQAGFAITGTWPVRTELGNRMRGNDSNALATSIVLSCRKRPDNAAIATRREFGTALQTELAVALAHLQRSSIAPVDLAQAAIGPGMAAYTRYAKVVDASGNPLSVREALALINQTLDQVLAEQEGDFDADSRWALAWFEQVGFAEGEYGVAETLSKAKNTSVAGMVDAGILASSRGKVRLLRPEELPAGWDPAQDKRLTAWESVHHLVRTLEKHGEEAAATLAAKLGSQAETARELAYRLYASCERKKRAAEALSYNGLVQSWPEIMRLAADRPQQESPQPRLFGDG